MDRQFSEWKLGVERICSAAEPDYREAARLAADIARASGQAILRQAATQALPILRAAAASSADPVLLVTNISCSRGTITNSGC